MPSARGSRVSAPPTNNALGPHCASPPCLLLLPGCPQMAVGGFARCRFPPDSCFSLSPDEGYEILSSLPDSVVYACRPCTGADGGRWRDLLDATLGKGLRAVLQGLQEAEQAAPLLQCAQVCFPSPPHMVLESPGVQAYCPLTRKLTVPVFSWN